MVGGVFEGHALNNVEFYDPVEDRWHGIRPLYEHRSLHTSAVLNGKLYVIGGRNGMNDTRTDSVLRYDPEEDAWDEGAGMNLAREGHASVVLHGMIYVMGGVGRDGLITASVER